MVCDTDFLLYAAILSKIRLSDFYEVALRQYRTIFVRYCPEAGFCGQPAGEKGGVAAWNWKNKSGWLVG